MDSDSDGDAPPPAVPLSGLQDSNEPLTATAHDDQQPRKPVPVTLVTGASTICCANCCAPQLSAPCGMPSI